MTPAGAVLRIARSIGEVIEVVPQSAPESDAIRRIAVLGNHMPRQCGIATFTTDLSSAIALEFSSVECFVLAMNDPGRRYAYPPRVRFEIAESDVASYRRAADFLNVNTVDVLSVQHEYGIFGGKAGGRVLDLLEELRMPIVTTLHTILPTPTQQQKSVLDELVRISERLVVMSQRGAQLLSEVHGVPHAKIDLIPHGIPCMPSGQRSKDRLGVAGKRVILTFGLLSPDKGIEYVIDALPALLDRHPDVVYVVLGATHPHVKERHGETYRLMLEQRARSKGVDSSIIFHNRFVTEGELADFLSAADIYVTPYLKAEQIASGTLARAIGFGKAVVSTPYLYALELLAEGRGVLVPWRDHEAIAHEIHGLLDDDAKRMALCERAAAYGRDMIWPAVARRYVQSFERAHVEHARRRRSVFQMKSLAARSAELPEANLDHLSLMTDGTGLLQHAVFDVPNYDDGYCLDDNARALIVTTLLEDAGAEERKLVRGLASRYLGFVRYAFNAELGRFRNFMAYSRRWLEDRGSEDSHGRALWALGSVVGRSGDPGRQCLAGSLFHSALPAVSDFTSPRAWAFALLGIDEYLRAFQGDSSVQSVRERLSSRLIRLIETTGTRDWPWFEDRLTYCNARLPQALIVSGARTERAEMTRVGLRSLEWLMSVQRSKDGYFAPVGSNGFYVRGEARASFDQQPVEAAATISACIDAFRATGDPSWASRARHVFDWFLGQNHLQQALYDPMTGGCRDALHAHRVNENQGAESTLSFLLALLEMQSLDRNTDASTGPWHHDDRSAGADAAPAPTTPSPDESIRGTRT